MLRELQVIRGVGPSIAQDLIELGIRRVSDLRGKVPEVLYRRHCEQKGVVVDRCVLYVFRCAVYFAESKKREPRLLLWWNWKDTPSVGRKAKLALQKKLKGKLRMSAIVVRIPHVPRKRFT